jgi:hypothetical protein
LSIQHSLGTICHPKSAHLSPTAGTPFACSDCRSFIRIVGLWSDSLDVDDCGYERIVVDIEG